MPVIFGFAIGTGPKLNARAAIAVPIKPKAINACLLCLDSILLSELVELSDANFAFKENLYDIAPFLHVCMQLKQPIHLVSSIF